MRQRTFFGKRTRAIGGIQNTRVGSWDFARREESNVRRLPVSFCPLRATSKNDQDSPAHVHWRGMAQPARHRLEAYATMHSRRVALVSIRVSAPKFEPRCSSAFPGPGWPNSHAIQESVTNDECMEQNRAEVGEKCEKEQIGENRVCSPQDIIECWVCRENGR
jgi:hypothetical protein